MSKRTVAAVPRRYHHGNLRQALLDAAEEILREEGVQGLKLRAITKRAGVSHTAADPHFGDLTGLLSELAASGYERLQLAMTQASSGPLSIALGYIGFAVANPDLFMLMFRSDALDRTRPRLLEALQATHLALAAATASPEQQHGLPLETGGRMAAAWALVHGLAMLQIDGRLDILRARIVPVPEPDALIEAALRAVSYS